MESVNLESGMAKLYELQTEMTRSIENMEKLQGQYDVMSDIVEKSGRESELPENFVQSIKEYKENINKQLPVVKTRLGYIKILIDLYEKQDKTAAFVDKIVSLAFAGLGLGVSENEDKAEKEAE
jgi:hypothetical protein